MKRILSDNGMLLVLIVLCAVFSATTIERQYREGVPAADELAERIARDAPAAASVLIVAQATETDRLFVERLSTALTAREFVLPPPVNGAPRDGRARLRELAEAGRRIDVIACTHPTSRWQIFDGLGDDFPALGDPRIVSPAPYTWPVFLNAANLLNIANQISIIAIIAIGMTLVIITAGIDLSVGSLIALSAVVTCLYIERVAGSEQASVAGMLAGALLGILVCAACGLFTGLTITLFQVPPFIVTLAMMMIASGTALLLTKGASVSHVPPSFVWLGQKTTLGLPNAVWLMLLLYLAAHVLMTRTVLGRYLYAVGGNPEAARLSGVPVRRVVLFAYVVSGMLAGLGGVTMASQLKSASPDYGSMYELYVIAAVVVGGTSLSGGEGKVVGTLIGAFIIAVIRNGMNLNNIDPFLQKVVLGVVILAAVLIDRLKHRFGTSD